MYERCLNEAERILAAEKDVIVPVKKIWKQVEKQGKSQGFEVPALVDFSALLEADRRFEFMPSHELGEEPFNNVGVEDPTEEAELENLGFYSGDRVKLRKVELTPELIGDMIRRKVDMTMHALTQAWEKRPEGDQETEDQLLEILAKTQKLQREVKKTFSEERMKELSTVLTTTKKKKTGKKRPVKATAKKKLATKKKRPSKNTSKPARPTRGKRK